MKFYFLLICFYIVGHTFAQNDSIGGAAYQQKYQLKISKAQGPIKLDGIAEETDWKVAETAKNFLSHWPQDNVPTKRPTEVKMTFDDHFLYVSAVCFDTNYHVLQTLKRDVSFWESDGFAFVLDPVNQKTNGFIFGLTPANVQSEDLISAGGFNEPNGSWDNKWYSQTKVFKDRWTLEIAIPFKTLRFDPTKKSWGVNFIRIDKKNNQNSTWTFIPVIFPGYDFGYTGALVWNELPPHVKGNVSVIPFLTGGISNDKTIVENPTKTILNAGLDAKIAVTPSLNLDITLNPDFSQIEVDQQVTNLTRFSVFFPERRTFFLENDDLFSSYGSPPFRPFFSRRIGLDENGNRIPIIGGVRLSGNLDKYWRVGLMNMQTQATESTPAQNFTAATFGRRVLKRSNIKGYVLNKTSFLSEDDKKNNPMSAYGRNEGLEFSYSNVAGTISAWTGYHLSQKPTINGDNALKQLGAMYNGRKFLVFFDYARIGTNYYADMGFINRLENYTYRLNADGSAASDTVIRLGYSQLYSEAFYTIRPTTGSINTHSIGINNFALWNPDGSLNEHYINFSYNIDFKNTSVLGTSFQYNNTNAVFPFSFTESKFPLPKGQYLYNQLSISYDSDLRKKFMYSLSYSTGGFYNGTLNQYKIALKYRVQPWGNFGLNFEQNDIVLPEKYGNDRLLLISPRIEINFSNSMFWTTFLQFNTQRNNFNVNSRFQWRYKPMSDFFLVYTDNYFTDPLFKNKSRAIVFKLNYWLTL